MVCFNGGLLKDASGRTIAGNPVPREVVARALATKPKLLLLDEPLGGMNPEEIAFSIDAISKMRDKGISILVVEHNMQILDILDSVTVISFGQKIFEGTPEGMRQDQTVIDTYFGGAV